MDPVFASKPTRKMLNLLRKMEMLYKELKLAEIMDSTGTLIQIQRVSNKVLEVVTKFQNHSSI